MSMSYKADCRECIEYLAKEKESLEKDELWDESSSELYADLDSYQRAIHAALETIEYYEGCSAILKAKEGAEYVEAIGMEWYHMQKAIINEKLGLGFRDDSSDESEDSDDPD